MTAVTITKMNTAIIMSANDDYSLFLYFKRTDPENTVVRYSAGIIKKKKKNIIQNRKVLTTIRHLEMF